MAEQVKALSTWFKQLREQLLGSTSNCEEGEVTVVAIPLPAQGHLNQFIYLSRIISSHNIHVHFVTTPTHIRQAKLRAHQGWVIDDSNPYFHFHGLSVPSFKAPPPDPNAQIQQLFPLIRSLVHLQKPLRAFLRELAKTSRRLVVIVDYFMIWLIQKVPRAELYCFHTISSFSLYYGNCVINGNPVLIDGQPAKDLPPKDSVFTQQLWFYLKKNGKSLRGNCGNIYNSCRAIEGQFLDLLAEEKLTNTDKHWAIGPFNLVNLLPGEKEKETFNEHLVWLDKQSPNSVIFVSFGSSCSISDEQVNEIATGLEMSDANFMWILRDADRGDIFRGETKKFQLPEGFEQRIEGRGTIVRDWAPQMQILEHPSTGGFLSHCGWNSTVESISMGVPILAWPMHSEQALNAILITQLLKIGMMVREGGLVTETVRSATIEEAVKTLMASTAGTEMRERARELSTAVKQSVKEEGATTAEISSFIAHINR